MGTSGVRRLCLYRIGGIIVRVGRPVREKILDGIIDDSARVMRVRIVGDSEGTFSGDVVGAVGGALSVVVKCGDLGVAGVVTFSVDGTGSLICTASGSGEAEWGWDDICESARCNGGVCS